MDAVSETKAHPSYVEMWRTGELERRAGRAREHLTDCVLCARQCHVNRLRSLRGAACRTGERAIVHSFGAHHGEESPLRGTGGSGTIFFGSCNMRCVFCQNHEISQRGIGSTTGPEELAAMMLTLQERGCHNVNLVSPSHAVAQILEALPVAVEHGLRLPLVYNSGGFDSLPALELLDGIVDVYMPDMKFGDSKTARHYSRVRNYVAVNRAAVREMHRQVGDLVIDDDGVAVRGLLVRHLVLPEGLSNTGGVLKFIASEISRNTYLNLMDQYHPAYLAAEYPPLDRPLSSRDFERAVALAAKYGLERLDCPNRFC